MKHIKGQNQSIKIGHNWRHRMKESWGEEKCGAQSPSAHQSTNPALQHSAFLGACLLLATLNPQSLVFAQGSAFTYQGRLDAGGASANGTYDLRFAVYDSASAGALMAGPLTNSATAVSNGLFSVTLDFAAGAFPGANRWLEIAVRSSGSGGGFMVLSPRQLVTATPYAVRAANFSGAVGDSQLSANVARLNANQTFSGTVAFTSRSNAFAGTFAGNGAGVTNMNLTSSSAGTISLNSDFFLLSASLAVAPNADAVTTADVNGDGRPDLISVASAADVLSVLTNDGKGGFALAASPAVGTDPVAVVAADVNGDGRMDLISADWSEGTLSVLTNSGSGAFTLGALPTVGFNPALVAAADINGDGRADLISADPNRGAVAVLTNNLNGGFTLASSLMVGNSPVAVAVTDVNGDGRADLITADHFTDTLQVLTNNGSGVWVLAVTPSVGDGPWWVGAAEVNGDGRIDLISANLLTNTLSVLTNNGSGGFALASSPRVGSGPISVVAVDVNGDGRLDLVSANTGTNTLSVVTNDGRGGFSLAASLAVERGPAALAAADFNADGHGDVVCANGFSNSLSVLLGAPYKFFGAFAGAAAGNFDGSFDGSFSGNGAALTNLNASNLSNGTVSDARLSANVARLNTAQTFTAGKTFASDVTLSGGAQLLADGGAASAPGLSFSGNPNTGILRPALNTLALSTASAERLRVTASGAVGIATTNPPLRLTVAGAGAFSSGSAAAILLTNTTATGHSWEWHALDDGRMQLVDFTVGSSGSRLLIQTNGNVGIGTASPTNRLHVAGGVSATAFVQTSDRNAKQDFAPVSASEVLAKVATLPVSTWSFKEMPGARHMGPTAQDFYAAFGLGGSDTTITTVDPAGVALAAIQGLNQKLEEQEALQKAKDARIAELERRLEQIARLVPSQADR